MTPSSLPDSSTLFSLAEAALRLEVDEATIREWLSTFSWERHYDGEGTVYLSLKDVEFLRVIKSLKDVDRSCESIVRIIGDPLMPPLEPAEIEPVPEPEPGPDSVEVNLAQIETLKAELRELHAKPAKKPFWKFWG